MSHPLPPDQSHDRRSLDPTAPTKAWVRQQLTFQNLLSIATIVIVTVMSTGKWVTSLTQDNQNNTRAIQSLESTTKELSNRVGALELSNRMLNEQMAKEFPRRVEVDLRLKAIDDTLAEQNILIRRMYERSLK